MRSEKNRLYFQVVASLVLIAISIGGVASEKKFRLQRPIPCRVEKASFEVLASCAQNHFIVMTDPVNPLIIKELLSWASDQGDQIHSINLLDSQDSNRFAHQELGYVEKRKGAFFEVSVEQPDKDNPHSKGLFKYAVEGKTDNGVYVIHTWDYTGGTLTLQNLLFLRVKKDHAFDLNDTQNSSLTNKAALTKNILLLEKLGDLPLGQLSGLENLSNSDREESVQTITVVGNKVTIETAPYQSSGVDKKVLTLDVAK
jgi:hypothetical protein